MCLHTYQWHSKTIKCDLQSRMELELPMDENGFCIFHSEDKQWKYDNDCFYYFIELLGQSNKIAKAVELHGVKITGHTPEQHRETKMFEGAAIIFTSGIITNDLTIFDSTFYDDVHLQNMRFLGNVSLHTCQFFGGVELQFHTKFREDLDILDHCIFHKIVTIDNQSLLDGPTQIISCTFHDSFYLDDVICNSPVYINDNQFTKGDEVIDFTGTTFKMGISFNNNSYQGLLNCFESNFHDENSFINIPYNSNFELADCQYYGSVLFQGEEDKLMFGPNTILKIQQDNFHNSARFAFDYCDILNLNDDFIGQAKDLQDLQLLKISSTSRTQRFVHKVIFKGRDVNQEIIEDYTRVISRYFSSLYTTRLNVRYRRLTDQPALEVVYSSDEDLKDQFDERLQGVLESIKYGNEKINEDLSIQLQSLLLRLKRKEHNGQIETSDTNKLLSHLTDKKMSIEIIMGNNYNINQVNTGNNSQQTLSTGDIGSIKINEVKALAEAAKTELGKQSGFAPEQLTQAAAIIDDILERYEKGEKLDTSWKEKLLNTTGSLASIVSFLQGVSIG